MAHPSCFLFRSQESFRLVEGNPIPVGVMQVPL